MSRNSQGERIGVFSVHGISRHDPLRMAADVTEGIVSWLQSRSVAEWTVESEPPVNEALAPPHTSAIRYSC